MSEPENFIARWSRRKAEAAEQDVAPVAKPDAPENADAGAGQKGASTGTPPAQKDSAVPEIDLSTLPPIESIGAGTDITAFLRAGVPSNLARAALRRAWASDPEIRDFIGLSENSWDFTAIDGVPGFGPLSAEAADRAMAQVTGKAKELVERIAEIEPNTEADQTKLAQGESSADAARHDDESKNTASPAQEKTEQDSSADLNAANSLQCDKENIATQQNKFESNENSQPTRRAHGGALPD